MASQLLIHSVQWTLLVILNSNFWCCSTSEGTLHQDNVRSNDIRIVSIGNSTLEKCKSAYRNLSPNQMARFRDASGKEGSGIYRGNTLWYGSYSECREKLSESRYCLTIFAGKMSLVPNQTETYRFEWGVCVPNVCTEEDVSKDFKFFMYEVSGIKSVTPLSKRIFVKCAEDPEYTASVVITIVFCGLLVGVCILATVVGMVKYKPPNSEVVENGGYISMDNGPNEKTPLLPDLTTKRTDKGLFRKILHSFSITRNVEFIMNTNVGKSDLTYLHGIRVLSLFWIILYHINTAAVESLWPYDNLKDMLEYERKLAPMVLNTAYGVDTFFVLSGLLVMYTNMSKKMKNNGRANWFKYYFHRFWRLTPTYMFCILFIAKLRPFFGAGPVWFMQTDTSACSDNWWTHLLYINNMVHVFKSCLPHSWYLAVDMQLFLISPIFLLIGYRYKLRSLIGAVGVTILGSIIVTACILAHNGSLPLVLMFMRLNFFFRDDIDEVYRMDKAYAKDVYMKPYCRISPYVIGMVVGYILYRHFSKQVKLPMKLVVFMWLFVTALALTDMYAPYSSIKEDPRIWTTGEKAVLGALRWPIWGLCIVWLIFACHYNYAGLIKDILAAKFWIPLSRINYGAYIVHFDIIHVLVYNIETPIHYTSFTTVIYFLSSLVLTYAVAFIITVVVELPFANLEALAWKKWERK